MTVEKIIEALEEAQGEVNSLHKPGESEDRNDEIEIAYKAIQEALDNLENLSD